jgi:hypothetical protein
VSAAEQEISRALEAVKTFDPHCHLRVWKPSADNLADILQYHHVWIELVSSGMGQQDVAQTGLPQELADPQIPPLERARRIVAYLPNIANTTLGLFLKWILRDLYSIDRLTLANFDEVWALVETRAKDAGWIDELLRVRCGIEASISVEEQGTPYSPRLLKAREVYATNLISGKLSPQDVLAEWERVFGREIRDAQDYVEFLRVVVDSMSSECRFIGLWVLPHLSGEPPLEGSVTAVLRKVRDGQLLEPAEIGAFCTFGLVRLLEVLRKTPIRLIQLIVGAEVLPPHRSITQWDSAFPGAMARLASRFEEFHFSLSSASDIHTQDVGVLAKHLPNISVAGYWWHTLYPFYVKKSLETRLDMVPINKIVAYFSDAYHAEWCYPKLKMIKQVLGEIIQERLARGWYDMDTALRIIQQVFYDNPKAIYFTPPRASG